MPEIARFASCKICVYADHAPPHFHVRGPGWNVTVDLKTLTVMRGQGNRAAVDEALEWAVANQKRLWNAWKELNERD
jgi:hypothetical protein